MKRLPLVTLLLALAPTPLRAQPAEGPPLPPPAAVVAGDLAGIESQLAALLRQRRDSTADDAARLDLQIDLRVLRRRLLTTAAAGSFDDPAAVAALLREADLARLTDAADAAGRLDSVTAAKQLHDRTFALRDDAHPDAVLDGVGRLALLALGEPVPATLPEMRPPADPPTAPDDPTADPADRPPTARELAAQIARLPADAALKSALAELAGKAESDADAESALRRAVGLAAGLGDLPEAERADAAGRLADALVLYLDPRLADAGRRRLGELENLADVVAASRALPASAAGDFAPMLAAARQDPLNGPTIIALVRDFHAVDAFPQPNADRGRWAAAIERLRARHGQRRTQVLAAAKQFGTGGVMAAGTDAVRSWVEEMARLNALAVAVADAPSAAAEVERALRVTPTGGLERAASAASAKIDDPADSPERRAADAVLLGLSAVRDELAANADLAAALRAVDPAVDRDYAGGGAATLAQRRRDRLAAAADAIASGTVPAGFLEDLEYSLADSADVAAAVAEAAGFDSRLAAAGAVRGWADWTVGDATLRAMYEPYRLRLARAVDAVGTADAAAAWAEFAAERDRMRPLTGLIAVVAARAEAGQLPAPPDGLAEAAALVETDSADAPFAAERLVSAAARGWVAVRDDPEADRAALDALLTRLADLDGPS